MSSTSEEDDVVIKPHSMRLKLTMTVPKVTATYSIESNHLIKSHKNKLTGIIKKITTEKELSQEELIDAYVSLHIILEVGINTILRKLALAKLKKSIDPYKAMEHLDEISFRDKVTSLIYFERYEFGDELEKASKNLAIISELKKFCEPRNKLLHGHAIVATGDTDGNNIGTATSELLNNELFIKQLARFSDIVTRFYFYLNKLDPRPSQLESYKGFLDNEFIPSELISRHTTL